jgi:hypothetical protein
MFAAQPGFVGVVRFEPPEIFDRGRERMGLKGDKSGEMSVSNALTALTKANQVARRDGRYVAA